MMIPPSAGNLPFSGIPPELADDVKAILEKEGEKPTIEIDFKQNPENQSHFSLTTFLKPYSAQLFLALCLVVIATISQQAGPMLTAYAIDHGISAGRTDILRWCFIGYLVSIASHVLASYLRIQFTGRLAQKLLYQLRIEVFSQMQKLSLEYYTSEKMGKLLTRMTSDIEALANLFNDGLVNLAVQGLTLIIIIACLIFINPTLAFALLIVVAPIMIILTLWFKNTSDKGYAIVRDKIAEVMADLQENLAGFRTLIAFNRRSHNVKLHDGILDSYRKTNVKMGFIQYSYDGATTFINVIGQVTILVFGFHLIQKNELTVGELVAFQLFLSNFFGPLQNLVQLYNGFQSGNAATKKIGTLFSHPIAVEEKKNATDLTDVKGHIKFKGVNFSYQNNIPVLKDINFELLPGEKVAFVGATGAGKSTIAKLITRFYDCNDGAILIDDKNIKDISFKSLRSQIGVVPQEAFLFNASIASNLSFSDPNITHETILKACDTMGIRSLINKQPEGLNTILSERGASLSSGERQLLALARAFISNPQILILDEATSNIDNASENKIELALDTLLGDKTAIIIAHRLATAMKADKIIFIDKGEIAELGSHQELLEKDGQYAQFFKTWQS